MKGLLHCILCSDVVSEGGLGITRMCENGSDLEAKFKGLLGGGPYEVALAVRFALRDGPPCVAQGCQQYFLLVKMYALISRENCLQVGV